MNPILGIDFGTRNTCAGIWRNNQFEAIPDALGHLVMPSIVSFHGSCKLIGNNALILKGVHTDNIISANTIYDIKRLLGRSLEDPNLHELIEMLDYNITLNEQIEIVLDNALGKMVKTIYTPIQITSFILSEVKKNAQAYLESEVKDVILTVPVHYGDQQRRALLDAASASGFNCVKIINESTAAALAHGCGDKFQNKSGNIIVYDLGAGTLDISLLNIDDGFFNVISSGGNSNLGGEDFDNVLQNHVYKEFKTHYGLTTVEMSPLDKSHFRSSVENAKKTLTYNDSSTIIMTDRNNRKFTYILTREIFERVCNNLIIMCLRPLDSIISASKLSRDDIDEIILVGGSSKILKIQEDIKTFFSGHRTSIIISPNPDTIVATGAAINGHIIQNKDDPFTKNIVLTDVTPLTLGVEVHGNQMVPIIERGTIIPASNTLIFSSNDDDEDSVLIRIFQGERLLTENNILLAEFILSGFEKGPRGSAKIKITFDVDLNGILHVTAVETKSNISTSKSIDSKRINGSLSKKQIDEYIAESLANQDADNALAYQVILEHNINNKCKLILTNLKDEDKKIKEEIENILSYLNGETELDEIIRINKDMNASYTSLMFNMNSDNLKLKAANSKTVGTTIYNEDDDEDDEQYSTEIMIGNSRKEITSIKETIHSTVLQVDSIINNPSFDFEEEDIVLFSDYLDSVQMWILITSSDILIEYVNKLNEVNKETEKFMQKYQTKEIFSESKVSAKEELNVVCRTLMDAIKQNHLPYEDEDLNIFKAQIRDIKEWLTEQDQCEEDCQEKLNEVNDYSAQLYARPKKRVVLTPVKKHNNPIKEDISKLLRYYNDESTIVRIDLSKLD